LAKQLHVQRRRYLEMENQKQEWSVAAMFIDESELNEQSL
jgi:hypothetical protein